MAFPEGCMWRDGSLYVAAPPQIWKLTDSDGVADNVKCGSTARRSPAARTICTGRSPGRTDGFTGQRRVRGAATTRSRTEKNSSRARAHIFRARPDGSGIEPVITGGMDNPVASRSPRRRAISHRRHFCSSPRRKRDGIIHAIYGALGKSQRRDRLGEKNGDLMPVMDAARPAARAHACTSRRRFRRRLPRQSFRLPFT